MRPLTMKDLLKSPYREKPIVLWRLSPAWEYRLWQMRDLLNHDQREELKHTLTMLASDEQNTERVNRIMTLFTRLLPELE